MSFLLFMEGNDYTTDSGEPCSFEDHLDYLRKWGGSPDNFDDIDTIEYAIELADGGPFDIVVVDSLDYEVVYESKEVVVSN